MRGGDLMRRSLLSPAGGVLACLLFLPGSMSFTGPPPLLGGQHPRLWNCRVGRAGGRVFICVPHGDGGLRGSRGLQATGSATGPALASKLLAGEAGGTGVEAGAVRVFDGAVGAEACEAADKEAAVLRNRGDAGGGHWLLDREEGPSAPLEHLIHACLQEMGDGSRWVEYWARDEWLNLDAHRDVDEMLARRGEAGGLDPGAPETPGRFAPGAIRFPTHAHVLYLALGEKVVGPTLVLDDGGAGRKEMERMFVVPAKQGRLVRFSGDRFHAVFSRPNPLFLQPRVEPRVSPVPDRPIVLEVPRPPLAYLDPVEGGTNNVMWTRKRKRSNGKCDESTVFKRSVLLFNTWEEPPRDVPKEALYREVVGEGPGGCVAKSGEEWREVDFEKASGDPSKEEEVRLKVGIMGDTSRREGRAARFLELRSPRAVAAALEASEAPTVLPLREL